MKKILIFLSIFILVCPCLLTAQSDNYGAAQANKRFLPSRGMLGGRTDFSYLQLENHPAASGVPLGGIGVGNVEFAPDGRFVRIGLNNIHIPIPRSKASYFALWFKTGRATGAQRLVRDSLEQAGMKGVAATYYRGLFPRAELHFGEELSPVIPRIHAYSGLVPHDLKHSSLPVVFFDVELEARETGEAAIAFAWEDFIGRGLKEPRSLEGMDGQIFNQRGREQLVNGEHWPAREAVSTFAEPWRQGSFRGVRQFAPGPIIPLKATFQNYVSEVALLAEQQQGVTITALPAYDLQEDSGWSAFRQSGAFAAQKAGVERLSVPGRQGGSALSVKTQLRAGEKKTIRFMLAWFYPELTVHKEWAAPGSYWPGGSDYGRYFHNFFDRLGQLVQYGADHRASLLRQTRAWQDPILNSTLPDWLRFKVINSAYVIYTNVVLNRRGDVMINEGGMGGLAGTMDQRISSHPFYQKFFTQLDRSEMEIFADAQAVDGSIPHFIGHYYVGMGTRGGRIPTENNWMLDNTEGWIIQLAKDYEQTGDRAYLQKYTGRVKDGMAFLKSKMPPGVFIPVGPTTYDDFTHPPVYSYGAGMYLATLKAAEAIATAVGDTAWQRQLRGDFDRSQRDMIRLLWNGRFFSYGCETDGTGRLDHILFTGQLAGQFVSRYCGWGDILPFDMVRAALVAQFKTSLSRTPDYYANKVWDLQAGRGIDQQGSQCWPFYLESYTAYPALQAGYVDDALDIMRHIQLVHLRKGWTWCQNLWNPAELNYMTAPVSWFSTDLLAGAGVNVPRGELRLAPLVAGTGKTVLPLFYPRFWGVLTLEPSTRKATLAITKVFGEPLHLRRLVIEPAGKPTHERKEITLAGFEVQEGRVLDLSPWWKELTGSERRQAVLPRAGQVPFLQVDSTGKQLPAPAEPPAVFGANPYGQPNRDVFCFYYNWYGNPEQDQKYIHWAHPVIRQHASDPVAQLPGGENLAANFYPRLGAYSSRDTAVIRQHMRWLRQAAVGVVVLSWWGREDFTDTSVPVILEEAARAGIRVAFHIEPFAGRNARTTGEAIRYLTDRYGAHPAFYRSERHGGRPFFFVYDSYLTPASDWATLLKEGGGNSLRRTSYDAVVIGLWVRREEGAFFEDGGFDGLYTYFATTGFTYGSTPGNWKVLQQWAAARGKVFVPCVGPGYIDTRVRPWNEKNSRDRRGGKYYAGMFRSAISSGAAYIGITSFNEWHEGTQIEPAVPFQTPAFTYRDYAPRAPDYYLEQTRRWLQVFARKKKRETTAGLSVVWDHQKSAAR